MLFEKDELPDQNLPKVTDLHDFERHGHKHPCPTPTCRQIGFLFTVYNPNNRSYTISCQKCRRDNLMLPGMKGPSLSQKPPYEQKLKRPPSNTRQCWLDHGDRCTACGISYEEAQRWRIGAHEHHQWDVSGPTIPLCQICHEHATRQQAEVTRKRRNG